MIHTLKTLPSYWDAVERGEKNFEVRKDDRGFQKGDTLRLVKLRRGLAAEWTENLDVKPLERRIAYILTGGQFGIEPGYVVMGLERLP